MSTQPVSPAEPRAEQAGKGTARAAVEEEKARWRGDEFDDGRPGSGGVRREDLSPDDFE